MPRVHDEVWEYHFAGNNTRDNWVQLVCIYFLLLAGAWIAYDYFHAPWWIYAGIGFFFVLATIGGIGSIRTAGRWEIMLDRTRGGRIISPKGFFEFRPDELLAFAGAVTYRSNGESMGGGYVLIFRNCSLDLNSTGLKVFEVRNEIRRLWPDVPTSERMDAADLLPDHGEIHWLPLSTLSE